MDKSEKIGLVIAITAHAGLIAALSYNFFAISPQPQPTNQIDITLIDNIALHSASSDPGPAAPTPQKIETLSNPIENIIEEAATPIIEEISSPPPPPPKRPIVQEKKGTEAKNSKPKKSIPKKQNNKRPEPSKKQIAQAKPRHSSIENSFLDGIAPSSSKNEKAKDTGGQNANIQQVARLQSLILNQLRPHWQILAPSGLDVDKLRTTVRFKLDRAGNIIGLPIVLATTGQNGTNHRQVKLYEERALAAVRRAAPFQLPEKFYSVWQETDANFDKSLSR